MIAFCLAVFTALVLAATFATRAQFAISTQVQRRMRRGLLAATAVAAMVTGVAFIAHGVSATSGNNFGPVPLGTTVGPQPITVTGTLGSTIGSIQVISQNVQAAATPDYSDHGTGTCTVGLVFSAAQPSCTVDVNFTPQGVGQRLGAVQITGGGAVEGTTYIRGTGLAGQIAFTPGTIATPAPVPPGVNVQGTVIDASGIPYLTTREGGIYQITPVNVITLFAGVPGAFSFADGTTATAKFNTPSGLAIDGAGAIYVADTGNNAVRKIANGNVTTIAGGPGAVGIDGGPAKLASLNAPTAVAVDALGNVFIADNGDFRIRKVDVVTGIITTVAGNGTRGFAGDGGLGNLPTAQIGTAGGLVVDAAGNLFFSDSDSQVIRELDAAQKLHTYAGTPGVAGHAGDGGSALTATLNTPVAVGIDASGAVYFTDSANSAVRRIDAAQNINTIAGSIGTSGSGGDGGPATAAVLATPAGLVVSPQGTLYITDVNGTIIRRVDVGAVSPITFPDTIVSQSSAKQTLVVENTGNQSLAFTSLAVSGGYAIDASSTCTTSAAVLAGQSCKLILKASPAAAGTNNGTLTVVSNSLGGTVTTSVNLLNNGIAAPTQLVYGTPPTSPINAGGNLGIITVKEEDALGNVVTAATDPITLAINGPSFFQVIVNAVSGVATFDLTAAGFVTSGTYTITIAGPAGATVPAPFTLIVNPGPPTKFAVSAITPPAAAGGNLGTVTATIQDASGNTVTSSTAPVTVSITGPAGFNFTPVTVNALSGVATINLSGTPLTKAGSYIVTLTSPGLTGPAGTTFSLVAGPSTKFIVGAISTPITAGGNIGTVTATIQDANGNTATTSTAPVTVNITGPGSFNFTTAPVNAVNGIASINLASTALNTAGTYTVTLSSPGLTAPAASTVVVNPGAASKIAVIVPATVTAGGTLGTLTATIADSFGNTVTSSTLPVTAVVTGPNGYSQTATSGPAVNGVATVDLSGLPVFNKAGAYSVTFTAAGGVTSGTKPFSVTAGTATNLTVAAIPTPITAGGNIGTVTATIVDTFGNTVTTSTAAVTVHITGPAGFTFTSAPVNAVNGVAAINLSSTPLNTAGTYMVTVASTGLTSPAASTVVVNAQTNAGFLVVSGYPASINAGGTGTVTVTVEDQFHNTATGFTGTVIITSSDPIAVATPATYTYVAGDAGVHAFSVTLNTPGTQSITATTVGATGSQTGIVVGKITTTATLTLTPGGAGASYGVAQSLTATIAPATAGAISAGGTVQFKDNGAAIGAPVAVAGGMATLNLMLPAVGAHSYTALYSGDVNFSGATSNAVAFVVSQAATTTTLTSSAASVSQTAPVTFTATVADAIAVAPTGTVSFFDGTTLLGTGTLAGGTATLTTSFNTDGAHSITAVYGGDVNFAGSTSAALTQIVVSAFSVKVDPNTINLRSGENGFFAVTVTSNGSFSGLVNLSCPNLPNTMQCRFFPSAVSVSSNSTSQFVELVLHTRGIPSNKNVVGMRRNDTGGDAPIFPALAFWMPGAALSAFGLRRKGMNGRKRQALLLVVLMLGMGGMLGLAGCGSGDGPKTPAGTYTVTVAGTSGTLVNTTPITVVVR